MGLKMKKIIFISACCILLSGADAQAMDKNAIALKETHNLKTLIENIKATAEKTGAPVKKRTHNNLAPFTTHTGGGQVDYWQEVRATFITYTDVPFNLCLILASQKYPFFYETEAFQDMTIANTNNYSDKNRKALMFQADESMPLSDKEALNACTQTCTNECTFTWRFIDL